MKNLLMVTLLLVATVSGANGIERYSDDSKRANRVSWSDILDGKRNLQVDTSSVINPKGASLFNVCVYDESNFRVLKPKSKCVKYKTTKRTIPRSGGQSEEVKTCVQREEVEFQLVSSMYNKCVETKTEVVNPDRPMKDQRSQTTCTKRVITDIPTVQKADIYTQRREELYQFSKTYMVPDCDSLGGDLPDGDLPDGK